MIVRVRYHERREVTGDDIEAICIDQGWDYHREHHRKRPLITCSLPHAQLIDVDVVYPWGVELESPHADALTLVATSLMADRPAASIVWASPDYWARRA